MTTSGTYTFGTDTEFVDIFTEAYERCGIEPSEISANKLDSARRSLQYLFTDWANNGPDLFAVDEQTIVMTTSTQSYNLPVSTISILQAATRQVNGSVNTDLMISPISRAEYLGLPNKAQASDRPTQYYLQRSITPAIYPWPVLQAGSACSIIYYRLRMTQDVGVLGNTVDAPTRWMNCIAAGLAARLATKWAVDRKQMLDAEAQIAYDVAMREDREKVPYRLNIDMPYNGWGG